MRVLLRTRLASLGAVALCALALGACGGGDSKSEDVGSPQVGAPAVEDCERQPPGRADDGVNDDQGGSIPGTNPCHGP